MQTEIVEASMRPLPHGAVAERHQCAKQHVKRDGSDRRQAGVGRYIQDGDVQGHRVVGRRSAEEGNA